MPSFIAELMFINCSVKKCFWKEKFSVQETKTKKNESIHT